MAPPRKKSDFFSRQFRRDGCPQGSATGCVFDQDFRQLALISAAVNVDRRFSYDLPMRAAVSPMVRMSGGAVRSRFRAYQWAPVIG
jgi:hypothetical protein